MGGGFIGGLPEVIHEGEQAVGGGGGGGGGGGESTFDFRAVKAIVGTCQELEKEYFRLNEVPDPACVRPEPVLRLALARLLRRFEALPPVQGAREGDYKEYLWTQLKAIRQDLLIQNLKSAFAVEVYEAHARIALACSDLNEYNQCQTQLMELYREKSLPPSAFVNVSGSPSVVHSTLSLCGRREGRREGGVSKSERRDCS